MDFDLTVEQRQLRDTLRGFLATHYDFSTRTGLSRSDPDRRKTVWQAFANELGILGLSIPESAGGLGGTAADMMVVMEELGASLVVEPFLETAVIAGGLLAGAGGRDAELRRIVDGDARFAFAWAEPDSRYRFDRVAARATRDGDGWVLDGHKAVVTGAPWATDLLVTARTTDEPGGISLFLVDPAAPGVTLSAYPTIDGRRAADIRFDAARLAPGALVGVEGGALALVERIGDTAVAAMAAEAVGVMRRLVQDTIGYTKQRRQFDQPIADFQALQHRMVDMYMQLELATSATYLVTASLDAEPRERARAASTAMVAVGNALRFIGQNAVQLHGGMGMTDELAIGRYFKRATMIEAELGSVDYHLGRYTALTRAA